MWWGTPGRMGKGEYARIGVAGVERVAVVSGAAIKVVGMVISKVMNEVRAGSGAGEGRVIIAIRASGKVLIVEVEWNSRVDVDHLAASHYASQDFFFTT